MTVPHWLRKSLKIPLRTPRSTVQMLSNVCRCVSDCYPTHPWKARSVSTITQTPHRPPAPIFHSICQEYSFRVYANHKQKFQAEPRPQGRQCVATKWHALPVETVVPLVRGLPGLRSAASKHLNEQKGSLMEGRVAAWNLHHDMFRLPLVPGRNLTQQRAAIMSSNINYQPYFSARAMTSHPHPPSRPTHPHPQTRSSFAALEKKKRTECSSHARDGGTIRSHVSSYWEP